MYTLSTSIEITADARAVRNILKDFEKYGEWNAFIRSIEGEKKLSSRLSVFLQTSGTKG